MKALLDWAVVHAPGGQQRFSKAMVVVAALVFIACLYGLHANVLVGRQARFGSGTEGTTRAERAAVAEAVVAEYRGLVRGNYPTDPRQTRPLVPLVTEALALVQLPARLIIIVVEAASSLLAVAGFYLLASRFIGGVAPAVGIAIAFALALIVAKVEVGRLGDALNPAFFFVILWAALAGLSRRRVAAALLVLAVLPFGALQRYDLVMLGLVIAALWALRPLDRLMLLVAVVGAAIATVVTVAVIWFYEVHGLTSQLLYLGGEGSPLRITQLTYRGNWVIILALFNVTVPLAALALLVKRVPGKLGVALALTAIYTVATLFVGNVSEFRLLLPLLGMLLLALGTLFAHLRNPGELQGSGG